MHFDDLLKQVGEFGPYQKRVYILLVLPTIFTAFQVMSPIFIMGDQSHTEFFQNQ
ncbi:hypothetical protein KUTeg_007620 [Tegillarca granosa]|uniref:ABC transporter permease n=1 Tax=Tegillarca granosa TaxID=220873 RepID=A0ABQ9FDS2_TEGGR|nr:hypothetical protein KUTeg_007620 [Tegillarca granosa]